VTLTAPPKLASTTFVAFGDSMTKGEVPSEGTGRFRTLAVDPVNNYPSVLLKLLQGRYLSQAGAITVANAGSSGEFTYNAVPRLPSVIDGGAYKALLLLEGVNDFPDYQDALANMRTMVQYAKRRSETVFLATVPPENPFPACDPNRGKNWAFVDPYNAGLRSLAASENVTLVDVNADFHGDNTTLIDCDGLHPTVAGYAVIAQSFFTAIQKTLEIPSVTTSTFSALSRRFRSSD